MAASNPKSVRLWASYIIDWVLVVAFGLIAYALTFVHPHPHDFSLTDLSISYPYHDDTVPIWVDGVVSGVVPALVILAVSVIFVPGRAFRRGKLASQLMRLKLWELHTGWLGLAMSLATAVMFTQALKLFGKPRPNCLSRCQPDLSRVEEFYTGRYANDLAKSWALVDIGICTQKDQAVLFDGFQSWPSGHSSTAWSGLLYFTLYLCAKFAVVLPYFPSARTSRSETSFHDSPSSPTDSQSAYKKSDTLHNAAEAPIRHRDEAAAPPVYMLLFIIIPIGGAVYICLSRYMDYAHHGFDIISGSVLGAVSAYVSFRWYHLPVGRGSGWSWGPRSESRAFGIGIGQCGYVDEERYEVMGNGGALRNGQHNREDEVELGLMGRRSSVAPADTEHRVDQGAQDPEFAHAR